MHTECNCFQVVFAYAFILNFLALNFRGFEGNLTVYKILYQEHVPNEAPHVSKLWYPF